jgi:hypothetical protein
MDWKRLVSREAEGSRARRNFSRHLRVAFDGALVANDKVDVLVDQIVDAAPLFPYLPRRRHHHVKTGATKEKGQPSDLFFCPRRNETRGTAGKKQISIDVIRWHQRHAAWAGDDGDVRQRRRRRRKRQPFGL